jgi:uncharacterized membrane protein
MEERVVAWSRGGPVPHAWTVAWLVAWHAVALAPAQAQSLRLLELPNAPYNFVTMLPNQLNADGSVVVGWSEQGAVRVTPNGIDYLALMSLQPFESAEEVSADGTIVVGHGPNLYMAPRVLMRWSDETGFSLIGPEPGSPYNDGVISGMSADGSVVAGTFSNYTNGNSDRTDAFRWTESGGIQMLKPLPGDNLSSAVCVSDDGRVVVGYSFFLDQNDPAPIRPVRWIDGGPPIDMGWFPGATSLYPFSTNADGSVVMGPVHFGSWPMHIFRWTPSAGYEAVGSIPGTTWIDARDITPDATAGTGYSTSYGLPDHSAVYWREGVGPVDLRESLESAGVRFYGWKTIMAFAISDDGRVITGLARDKSWYFSGFVLDLDGPNCPADCDLSGTLDIDDFMCFVSLYASGHLGADCDSNEVLDIDDFMCFQTLWSAGCSK